MPKRLEAIWERIDSDNVKKSLYSIFLWVTSDSTISRQAYADWLTKLVDWYARYTGANLLLKDKQARLEKLKSVAIGDKGGPKVKEGNPDLVKEVTQASNVSSDRVSIT